MRLTGDALAKHVYLIGGTGTGKSKALESFAIQLVRSRQGIGVIDPHGELVDHLIAYIARQGKRLYDRIVLFDPTRSDYVVGFNPLELKESEIAERRAQFLATVIAKIFGADPQVTVRMQRILLHTFWLLMRFDLTLLSFAPVLTDPEFRASLLVQLPAEDKLRQYWQHEFPQSDRLVTEWTQSSLNKVDPLVIDPAFRLILGQKKSTIDFHAIIDEGKILLVKLPKGVLGEANSHLMGAFILAQIQMAALARAEKPMARQRPFTLLIDEFQNYTTDDIHEILAESRKYKLQLVMAHQYYEQLRDVPKLQAAVLNTVGNLICFRLGAKDAELFMRDMFTPDFYQIKDIRKRRLPTGITWWPYITEEDVIWMSLEEIWEYTMRELTQLPDRFFWYKRRGLQAAQLLQTLYLPDPQLTPSLQESVTKLRNISGQLYARPRTMVEQEIFQRSDREAVVRTRPPDMLLNPFDEGLDAGE